MITIILIDILIAIISCMIILSTKTHDHFDSGLLSDLIDCIGVILTIAAVTVGLLQSNLQNFKSKTVETPAKYTNQSYYIDNTKQLYIQQNDTTKPFGGNISSKIEYKESAKEPSIQFKTTKTFGNYDDWVPFKQKEEVKTSISKVILPKSALTGNLTKVNVLNQAQSDSVDLTLNN